VRRYDQTLSKGKIVKDTLRLGDQGADVRALQTTLSTLGDNLDTDGDFGAATLAAVRTFQSTHNLVADGVVGPKTWGALDQAVVNHTHTAQTRVADKLGLAGQNAAERATAFWRKDICDPRVTDDSPAALASKAQIDTFIRQGLGWTWEPRYAGDGSFEWCGAFAAMCWPNVKADLRKLYFASTFRLDCYASYRSFNGETNAGSGRLYTQLDEESKELPFEPRLGDILLIGPKDYGQHICVVESYDAAARVFYTIEGNGNGMGPDGKPRRGVVAGHRPLGATVKGAWCARRMIRPSVEDLT
jgi:putative peptidoglycan binding protein